MPDADLLTLKMQLDGMIERRCCSPSKMSSKRALSLVVRFGDGSEIAALIGLAILQQEAQAETVRNWRTELAERVQSQDGAVPVAL